MGTIMACSAARWGVCDARMTPSWGPQNVTRDVGKVGSPKVSTSRVRQLRDCTQASDCGGGAPARPPVPPPGPPLSGGSEGRPLRGQMGREQTPADLRPRPASSLRTLQPAGRRVLGPGVAEVSGAGPGSPELPPRGAAPGCGGGAGATSSSAVCHRRGDGKVRPQVCGGGRRRARRGAAIFGDLGAAGAPPAAREAAARAAPSPPAAGPESPAGRGWK